MSEAATLATSTPDDLAQAAEAAIATARAGVETVKSGGLAYGKDSASAPQDGTPDRIQGNT